MDNSYTFCFNNVVFVIPKYLQVESGPLNSGVKSWIRIYYPDQRTNMTSHGGVSWILEIPNDHTYEYWGQDRVKVCIISKKTTSIGDVLFKVASIMVVSLTGIGVLTLLNRGPPSPDVGPSGK